MVGMSASYGIRCVVRPGLGPRVPLRAICLQPNIPQTQKFDPNEEENLLNTLRRMTEMAAALGSSADLVVWPEAAIPRGIFAEQHLKHFVFEQIQRTGAPLLLGSLEPEAVASGSQDVALYNSALLLTDGPPALQSAQKRHLVPFGEFLPFRDWFPEFIQELVPGDIAPGQSVQLLKLPKPAIRMGALVCFEDSLSRETRDLALAGAQMLINITNDAWFGTSSAAAQHFANARFRAIETRLPLLRCSNTGITCAVDPLGRVESRLAPFTEGIDTFGIQVPEHPQPTVYTRFGDLWVAACGLNALALLWSLRRRR
jgi:apolipoprotein N-acyltransferase